MLTFHYITIKNFMSYGKQPTTLQLDRVGSTLIIGENKDDVSDGISSNGVGKTTWLDALSYALYDKTISPNDHKDDLVNNINRKEMMCEVSFTNNGETFTVRRFRKQKAGAAGNYVIIEDAKGEDITPAGSVNANAFIESKIGWPHDVFALIVGFSAASQSFFDLPVRSTTKTNQTDIIEEIFNLKTLSHKSKALNTLIKENKKRVSLLQAAKQQADQERIQYEQLLNETIVKRDNWETEQQEMLSELQNSLSILTSIDIDTELDRQQIALDIKEQLSRTNRKINDINKEIDRTNNDIKQLTSEIDSLTDERCPYCQQHFVANDNVIDELQVSVKNKSEIVDTLTNNLNTLKREAEKLSIELTSVQQLLNFDSIKEAQQSQQSIAVLEAKIESIKLSENPYVSMVKQMQESTIGIYDDTELTELQDTITHQELLYKLLTKKDSFIRKALINTNIPFLNAQLHKYLTDMKLPHSVRFNLDMTANITKFGRKISFKRLSSGQKARVNLAVSFAFRDVVQRMHSPVNVWFLDEVLDAGLDAVGVTAASKILKNKAREDNIALFLISHRNELEGVLDNTLTVYMKDEFSYIE